MTIIVIIIFLLFLTYITINKVLDKKTLRYRYLKKYEILLYVSVVLLSLIAYFLNKSAKQFSCKDGYICYCVKK